MSPESVLWLGGGIALVHHQLLELLERLELTVELTHLLSSHLQA